MALKAPERIAVFKGSIDPMHNGHEGILRQTLADDRNRIVYVYPAVRGRNKYAKDYKTTRWNIAWRWPAAWWPLWTILAFK